MYGQHPGRMLGVGVGGDHFYVFTFLHVLEHSEHICLFFSIIFDGIKLIIFTEGGGGTLPPFAENCTKNDF